MQFRTNRHPSDEVLEQYSMGRLDGQASQIFEEHLLICSSCQDNLAFADAYRASMRAAALELRQAGVNVQPEVKTGFRGLLPKPLWITGFAALALLVAGASQLPSIHHSVAQPALVLLESNRGPANPLNSNVAAGRPFTLVLDLKDLPALPQYRLEIVDATGRAVFGSSAAPTDNKLRATIAKGLPGGIYYVRVYGTELLREYGLEAHD